MPQSAQRSGKANVRVYELTVLVAATACGLFVVRQSWEYHMSPWVGRAFDWTPWTRFLFIVTILRVLQPLLFCWSIGIACVRLSLKSYRWRHLFLQPGEMACLVPAVVIGFNFVGLLIWVAWVFTKCTNEEREIIGVWLWRNAWMTRLFYGVESTFIGATPWIIATVWVLQAVFRVRRRGLPWKPTIGCALGAAWIVIGVLFYVEALHDAVWDTMRRMAVRADGGMS
jgi:hypothetical protein